MERTEIILGQKFGDWTVIDSTPIYKRGGQSKHKLSMTELYEFCNKVINYANQQPSIGLTTDEGSETNS